MFLCDVDHRILHFLTHSFPTRRCSDLGFGWRVILDQYGAADVLIPIARVEYSYPGGPIKGHFTARFGPDSKLISSFTMTGPSPAALPDMMEKEIGRASYRERVCQYV